MLTDDVYIQVKAGDGGNGIVHFYTDRWRPKGGPDGGNGGAGGDVIFKAVSDISALNVFRHKKKWQAENGTSGGSNDKSGADAKPMILSVPVGTVVEYDNGTGFELTELGQEQMVAKGGSGGRGNASFASSTNTTPKEATQGFKTQYKKIHLTLKLIADIGLVGLPNAGKSSLLNALTASHARVANYPFTTLEPNLGVLPNGKVMADIPGLIEGASEGKGLGYKFLRHVERTKLLVHCISLENQDIKSTYQTVRQELENYSETLSKTKEIVVLTKSDIVEVYPKFKDALVVSILDDESLKKLSKLLMSS